MTIERNGYDGPITFHCDGKRCAEVDETRCADFTSARAKSKSHGWTTRRVGEEWLHFCPEHSE